MATTEAALYPVAEKGVARATTGTGAWVSAALTMVAIAVHGYHPYAEDGGVYLAGVKRVLDPHLYPYWTDFVTTHLKFSLFAPMMAEMVRLSHLSLMTMMLLVYAGTTWFTLFSAWMLASRCSRRINTCLGAVTLLALTLTIPVAGTSLMLMDPYVTARSVSTPCGILMLVGALDLHSAWIARRAVSWRTIALCTLSFSATLCMHPLMAAYALGCVLLLGCLSLPSRTARIVAAGALCALAVTIAACVERLGATNSLAYAEVARSRTYWFLSTWEWYELLGLIGPPVVLMLLARRGAPEADASKRLAMMAVLAGSTAVVVAALFAQASSRSYEVAKLQPLRIYQTIYLLMLLALGAAAADRVLKKSIVRWAALVVIVGAGMGWVQRQIFPNSAHVEMPWRAGNAWEQAFAWVRGHTPTDAVFAMDANYIAASGEDSQNFRASAERSAMPDYAKDGGIAAIAPALTPQWLAGETAQKDLDHGVGPNEVARLRGYGVGWVVVTRNTPTSFACAYANAKVKVCRLP